MLVWGNAVPGANRAVPVYNSRREVVRMTVRELLNTVLDGLSEEQLREVADFAMFLRSRAEDELWSRFSLEQLAKAYGPDEPDYGEVDVQTKQAS